MIQEHTTIPSFFTNTPMHESYPTSEQARTLHPTGVYEDSITHAMQRRISNLRPAPDSIPDGLHLLTARRARWPTTRSLIQTIDKRRNTFCIIFCLNLFCCRKSSSQVSAYASRFFDAQTRRRNTCEVVLTWLYHSLWFWEFEFL